MLNTTRTQLMADRQTSLAAPHHHHIRRLIHHGTPPYTPRQPSKAWLGSAPVSAKRAGEAPVGESGFRSHGLVELLPRTA